METPTGQTSAAPPTRRETALPGSSAGWRPHEQGGARPLPECACIYAGLLPPRPPIPTPGVWKSKSRSQRRGRTCRTGPHEVRCDRQRSFCHGAKTPGPPHHPSRQLGERASDQRPPSPTTGGDRRTRGSTRPPSVALPQPSWRGAAARGDPRTRQAGATGTPSLGRSPPYLRLLKHPLGSKDGRCRDRLLPTERHAKVSHDAGKCGGKSLRHLQHRPQRRHRDVVFPPRGHVNLGDLNLSSTHNYRSGSCAHSRWSITPSGNQHRMRSATPKIPHERRDHRARSAPTRRK